MDTVRYHSEDFPFEVIFGEDECGHVQVEDVGILLATVSDRMDVNARFSGDDERLVVVEQIFPAPAVPWLIPLFEAVRVCEFSQTISRPCRSTQPPVFIVVVDELHARAPRRLTTVGAS